MNWSHWIRQLHRWLSIAFTVTVVANFVQLSLGGGNPPNWVTYSPLLPLALLMPTGLYMFVLPYAIRWRHRRVLPALVDVGIYRGRDEVDRIAGKIKATHPEFRSKNAFARRGENRIGDCVLLMPLPASLRETIAEHRQAA